MLSDALLFPFPLITLDSGWAADVIGCDLERHKKTSHGIKGIAHRPLRVKWIKKRAALKVFKNGRTTSLNYPAKRSKWRTVQSEANLWRPLEVLCWRGLLWHIWRGLKPVWSKRHMTNTLWIRKHIHARLDRHNIWRNPVIARQTEGVHPYCEAWWWQHRRAVLQQQNQTQDQKKGWN